MPSENAILALEEARKEVAMYKGLYDDAQERMRKIEEQLASEYTPALDRNYTAEEVRNCRRSITAFLTECNRPCSLWEVKDALWAYDGNLVQRELRKLASSSSPIFWNGKRGAASRYART